jgi:uncharacterized membrane protein (UPF0127 family)
MKRVKVFVGDKEYNCQVAESEEDRRKGLQNVEYLQPDEGMLFVWEDEGVRQMWMKDTKIPLDQIGINGDDEVVLVYKAQPEDETLVNFPSCKYILEVNTDSGITEGDDFEIDDETLDKFQMKVLAPDGTTQMFLQGGERICSRIHTKVLIKKAKKAHEHKKDNYDKYCKALGKYMFKVLHK